MGKRGPKPRSQSQKSREGYSRSGAAGDPFRPGRLVMPTDLRPAARECWRRTVAEMKHAGRLRQVDGDVLRLLADAWADAEELGARLLAEGAVITGANGTPVANPLCRLVRQARELYLRCRDQLCLTQNQRDRIPAAGGTSEGPKDPLSDFNARRPEGPPPGLKVTHG